MPQKRVVLRHPKLGDDQTITVAERTVPIHEKAGWKVAPKTQQTDTPKS
jgi:hypothetical protein